MSAIELWLNWSPKRQIIQNAPKGEPSKPSESAGAIDSPARDPGFVGIDGSVPGESSNFGITANASPVAPAPPAEDACAVLNGKCVRAFRRADGRFVIRIPQERGGADVRDALRVLALENLPVQVMLPQLLPYAEWKAQQLNALFKSQGRTGEAGRITAATIRHGILRFV